MLINIILIGVTFVAFGVLIYFLICLYKQYKGSLSSDYVELFPKKRQIEQNKSDHV